MRKYKSILSAIFFIFVCLVPFSSFASVNWEAEDYLHTVPNNTKILPDMHYILDDTMPYQMVFLGNNNILADSSDEETLNLLSYDAVLVLTGSQPINSDGSFLLPVGTEYSVYAADFEAELWTPIQLNASSLSYLYKAFDSSQDWDYVVLASNFNLNDVKNGIESTVFPYFWYVQSDYSIIDYNGNITIGEHILANIKLVSHIFVLYYLKPLIGIIISEPILLVICLSGLSISLFAFFAKLLRVITQKRKINRLKRL